MNPLIKLFDCIRSLAFILAFIRATIIVYLFETFAFYFFKYPYSKLFKGDYGDTNIMIKWRTFAYRYLYGHCIYQASFIKIKYIYEAKAYIDSPSIILHNHASMVDPFAIMNVLPTKTNIIAKAELGKIPIFGWASQQVTMLCLKREN